MELTEIAPGVDLERDILAKMAFKPVIPREPALMDLRIFQPGTMGLKEELLAVPLDERFTYDPQQNMFFVNFEGLSIRSCDDIEKIKAMVDEMLSPLPRKVRTVVNYDNFSIVPELEDDYISMVKYVLRYYESVTRYTTSAFLRMKLGDALQKRGVAPHIFEKKEEAERAAKQ
jgi:propionate CoA-transferase